VFTGIIMHRGTVAAREGRRISIACPSLRDKLAYGMSIAVDGVCLTAAELNADGFIADLLEDTLAVTTLGEFAVGRQVHLEAAMLAGDSFSGHFVQGHVDNTVRLLEKRLTDYGDLRLWFELPDWLAQFVHTRAALAINGVSLTVQSVEEGRFQVSLIPTTILETCFSNIEVAQRVNIEADLIIKTVNIKLADLIRDPLARKKLLASMDYINSDYGSP
jgi:riboflavin synthase